MRFSMMLPSVFKYIRYRMFSFSTGIELKHVERLVEGDLPRDRLIKHLTLYILVN